MKIVGRVLVEKIELTWLFLVVSIDEERLQQLCEWFCLVWLKGSCGF